MRRILIALPLSLLLILSLAGPAGAEGTTVKGEGDLTRMRAVNATKAVKVKLFGLDEPCGGAQYFNVQVRWGRKAAYEVAAGCYGGTDWGSGLFYLPDRSDPQTVREVACDSLKVTYNADKGFHRIVIPRSCMKKANDRVRVWAEGHNYGTVTGGSAGPTKLLDRG